MKSRILLADDELVFRDTFAKMLREEGLAVTDVTNGTDAIEAIADESFDVAILDIQMPGADGIKVLREIVAKRPEIRVIMITAYGTVEMAVEAIKLGACDYVMKPVMFDDVLAKVHQQLRFKNLEAENRQLKTELNGRFGIGKIVGRSPVMQQVFETIRKVAHTKSNVLVVGESGTGKELVARAIHAERQPANGRFVGVNCGAIPESLMESELFGHTKGSFTGAVADKKGLFEAAEGGTLFLDEIACMAANCQAKLLRAIEERQILPVGATTPIQFGVKLIAGTNRDPAEAVNTGEFREDLYYRLNVVGIYLPPLRERRDDIPLLVDHFIDEFNQEMGKNCQRVADDAMQVLLNHDWKGNVRELQNVIERAIIFSEGDVISVQDLGAVASGACGLAQETENLQQILEVSERTHLWRVLEKYDHDKGAAAKALGVGLSSLYRKISQLGIGGEHATPRNGDRSEGDGQED